MSQSFFFKIKSKPETVPGTSLKSINTTQTHKACAPCNCCLFIKVNVSINCYKKLDSEFTLCEPVLYSSTRYILVFDNYF